MSFLYFLMCRPSVRPGPANVHTKLVLMVPNRESVSMSGTVPGRSVTHLINSKGQQALEFASFMNPRYIADNKSPYGSIGQTCVTL